MQNPLADGQSCKMERNSDSKLEDCSVSTPPTSIAPSSSPPKCSSPLMSSSPIQSCQKTAIDDPALQIDEFSTVVPMKSVGHSGRHKRPIQMQEFTAIGNKGCRFDPKRYWGLGVKVLPMSRINLGQLHWLLNLFAVQPLYGFMEARLEAYDRPYGFAPLLKVKYWYTVHQVVIIPSSFYLTNECRTILTRSCYGGGRMPSPDFCTSSAHDASARSSRYSDSASLASTSLISPNTTNMDPGGTEGKRFKDYNSTEQVAPHMAKKRCIILNSVTTTGWLRNITPTQKKATNNYVIEIINQANMKFGCELETSPSVIETIYKALLLNRRRLSKISEDLIDPYDIQPLLDSDLSERDRQAFKDRRQNELFDSASPFTYYLHGQELTDMSVFIVLFANPVVEDTHIAHWYAGKDTPLRDEDMRLEIKTTPTQMFSELVVSVRLAIRRAVSGKTLLLGTPLCFSTNPYADEQDAVNEAMLLALASSIHGPAMEAHMLYVHQRGMGVLRGAMGLEALTKAIRNPLTEGRFVNNIRHATVHTGHWLAAPANQSRFGDGGATWASDARLRHICLHTFFPRGANLSTS
ncbi:hypothetical protein DFH29DRAFT_883414 [Suillus ampliporus]|nr:hypothetical protein DFH29DRAFT_883414 [Suillus ampliporus]